jgi:hypothetical protein
LLAEESSNPQRISKKMGDLGSGEDGISPSCGLIINENGGFPSEGNSDEMWFNLNTNHYFLAVSTCKQTVTTTGCLGIIDAGPPPSAATVAGTAPGSHSVAADSLTNQVYVPIRGNAEVAPPGPFGTTCSKGKDVFGLAIPPSVMLRADEVIE